MRIKDVAEVRTGLVIARKKVSEQDKDRYPYKMLNLKCILPEGYIDFNLTEAVELNEKVKPEFTSHIGDILIRLTAPYTAVMITKSEECGYIIPSHFAVIRVDENKASPEYIYWVLKRDTTKQKIIQNISGSTAFGTISSGFFNELKVNDLPLRQQQIIGKLTVLSDKEQELLHELTTQKLLYNKIISETIYKMAKRGK